MKLIFSQNLSISYLFSVMVLLLLNFGFFPMSGGEEQYMGLTAQWANPDWIVNSFTFTEFPGTRLIFQCITAPFISVFGIKGATFFLRIITLVFVAVPISMLLKQFKLTLLTGLVALQIFFSYGQYLFGGEWIVNSYEPKAIAYFFALLALPFYFNRSYYVVAVLLALSTYFHFLVGGWILFVLGLIMLIEGKWIVSLKSFGLYVVLIMPFVFYLYEGYFMNTSILENSVDPSWIYCYYRLPHHTGIFKSYEFFLNDSLIGVLLTIVTLLLSIKLRRKKDYLVKAAYNIVIACLTLNLLFVVGAWIDGIILDQKASFLIKYYPFRTNSLALLLFLLLSLKFISQKWNFDESKQKVKIGFISFLIILLGTRMYNEWRFSRVNIDLNFDETARMVKQITESDAVLATVGIPLYDGRLNRFSRLAERDLVATLKFTPAESAKTLAWFDRIKAAAAISKKPEKELKKFKEDLHITYLISVKELSNISITEVFRNKDYIIYKIND